MIEMQQLPPLICLSGAIKLKQDLGSHSIASAAPIAPARTNVAHTDTQTELYIQATCIYMLTCTEIEMCTCTYMQGDRNILIKMHNTMHAPAGMHT